MSCGSVEKQQLGGRSSVVFGRFVLPNNIATTKTSTTTIYDLHSFGLLRDTLSQYSHRLLCM